MADYQIILNATGYFEKGVLLEEDLEDTVTEDFHPTISIYGDNDENDVVDYSQPAEPTYSYNENYTPPQSPDLKPFNIGNYTSLCFNSDGSVEDVEPTGVEMIGVDIVDDEADAEALNAIVEDAAEESMEESAESAEGADVAVE